MTEKELDELQEKAFALPDNRELFHCSDCQKLCVDCKCAEECKCRCHDCECGQDREYYLAMKLDEELYKARVQLAGDKWKPRMSDLHRSTRKMYINLASKLFTSLPDLSRVRKEDK